LNDIEACPPKIKSFESTIFRGKKHNKVSQIIFFQIKPDDGNSKLKQEEVSN